MYYIDTNHRPHDVESPNLSTAVKLTRLTMLLDLMKLVKDTEIKTKHKLFDMDSWQQRKKDVKDDSSMESCGKGLKPRETAKMIIQNPECGTKACVSGWVAVAPEFKKLGVEISQYGSAVFDGVDEEKAFVRLFDISDNEAYELVRNTEDDWGVDKTLTNVIKQIAALVKECRTEAKEELADFNNGFIQTKKDMAALTKVLA